MELSEDVKGILLLSARNAIKSLFETFPPDIIDFNLYPSLITKNQGVFVTLTIQGELRGCIGFLHSDRPLIDTVIDAARHAAVHDPRFPKVHFEEVPHLEIEISVLSEPFPIEYDEIQIGKHGLVLEEKGRNGLLLPQVAPEYNFGVPEFLSAVCQKAGVDPNLWKKKQLNLKAFTAMVFSESGKRKKTCEYI